MTRDGCAKWRSQPVCCLRFTRYDNLVSGAVAQLVAHLHGMEGVRGSNPLSSTEEIAGQKRSSAPPIPRLAQLGEQTLGMAGAARRGYGEDGIYFDHRGDCGTIFITGRALAVGAGWVSLGFDADGKRIRRKVSGYQDRGQGQAQGAALRTGRGRADGGELHGGDGGRRLAGRGAAGAGGEDGLGVPGCAGSGAGGHRSSFVAGPYRAGCAGCAGEDGGYPFDADAAEGT